MVFPPGNMKKHVQPNITYKWITYKRDFTVLICINSFHFYVIILNKLNLKQCRPMELFFSYMFHFSDI